ncbi:MAG: hypothetical protein ABGY95_00275 [Rubritalea sp.]|uniref:hypothetical protein n=1 Tax=Rubritalea sp. TaxID=2109375 RepID=UPI0032429B49
MRPYIQLFVLIFGALFLGSYLYVQHTLSRVADGEPVKSASAQEYIVELETELDQLRRDNASLRALIAADSPIDIEDGLLRFVEKDLSLSFRTPPIALMRSEDAMREAAGQLWLGAFGEVGLEIRSYAYDVLGILPPNQNFIGQIIAAETTGAIGVYDHSSAEILLTPHYDSENVHHQAGLIRLLAIALLEQHAPLPNPLTDDQFFSYLALHRGRASMLQDRFYAIQARNIGFIDSSASVEAQELFSALPPLVRFITTFPNQFGKDYLARLPNKQAIDLAIRSTDTSCQSLLLGIPPSETPFTPQEGESIQLSTQLGALTIKGFLAQLEPSEQELITALKAYHSDTLTISTEGGKSASTSWTLSWKSADSAAAFHKKAKAITNSLPTPPNITLDGLNVTLKIEEPLKES